MSSPFPSVVLIPLHSCSGCLFWWNKDIRFMAAHPLRGLLREAETLLSDIELAWSTPCALSDLEQGLERLEATVPFEEKFAFHMRAAVLRITLQVQPCGEPVRSEPETLLALAEAPASHPHSIS